MPAAAFLPAGLLHGLSGALAERNTFQGERCIYNALNNRIRNLLLSYDYSKSTDPLQPWSSHIMSLLTRTKPNTSDITLIGGAESFQLHKFLLTSRSPYFRRKLADAPETTTWRLSHSVPVEAFHVVLKYLYLGPVPRDLVDPRSGASEEEVFKGIDKISKQLEVEKLWEAVLSVNDRRLARQRHQDEVQRAQGQVENFFRENVLKHKMLVETRKSDEIKWPLDNFIFADCLLRADEEGGDDEEVVVAPPFNGIPVGPPPEQTLQNGTRRQKRSVSMLFQESIVVNSCILGSRWSSGSPSSVEFPFSVLSLSFRPPAPWKYQRDADSCR